MTLQLIVNADDYGRSPNVSRGIRQAHRQGIVTSTTCMMNFANVADDLSRALQETPALGLGVHLVLTAERPLLPPAQLPTLTTREGTFPRLNGFLGVLAQQPGFVAEYQWVSVLDANIVVGMTVYESAEAFQALAGNQALLAAMMPFVQDYPPFTGYIHADAR